MSKHTNAYEVATNLILEQLREGTIPWNAGWSTAGMPRRLARRAEPSPGAPYRGINILTLAATGMHRSYTSNVWATYKAWRAVGGQVRKGETGTPAFFWKRLSVRCRDGADCPRANDPNHKHSVPLLRVFNVFNAEQAFDTDTVPDGLGPETRDVAPIAAAEEIAAGYLSRDDAPAFGTGGDRAFYSPVRDHVQVPAIGQFQNAETYHATLFHELTHSTGHASRLARPDLLESHAFGDENYSREELVAEMGAAMLSASAGIVHHTAERSAAYVSHWLGVLSGDPKLLVVAAAQAQRAADLVQGVTFDDNDDD